MFATEIIRKYNGETSSWMCDKCNKHYPSDDEGKQMAWKCCTKVKCKGCGRVMKWQISRERCYTCRTQKSIESRVDKGDIIPYGDASLPLSDPHSDRYFNEEEDLVEYGLDILYEGGELPRYVFPTVREEIEIDFMGFIRSELLERHLGCMSSQYIRSRQHEIDAFINRMRPIETHLETAMRSVSSFPVYHESRSHVVDLEELWGNYEEEIKEVTPKEE